MCTDQRLCLACCSRQSAKGEFANFYISDSEYFGEMLFRGYLSYSLNVHVHEAKLMLAVLLLSLSLTQVQTPDLAKPSSAV